MSSLTTSRPLGLKKINPVRDDIIVEYKKNNQIKSRRDGIKSHYMDLKSKESNQLLIKNMVIKLTPIRFNRDSFQTSVSKTQNASPELDSRRFGLPFTF